MTEESAKQPSTTVRSVDRAFQLLELLETSDRPLRLVDLSSGAGLQNATTLRILRAMEQRGFVVAEHGEYRLGPAALGLANGFLLTDPLSNRCRPVMQQLSEATGLTTNLYVRVGNARVLTLRVDGESPLRYQMPLGRRLPLHVGAGKTILAALPRETAEELLPDLPGSPAEYREQLAAIRRDGYHISVEERDIGFASVSVPLYDQTATVLGAISAVGPTETVDAERLLGSVPELRRAAQAVNP
ncbi:IclR family transcriptional regulator [Prauserella cavernicola]|uniref:IclR family transcriptional regulator n=1 Tax=Prauserella cavernicola TaxID=2800127 RepID=A0A934V305_9PSEU|nr:IclR family transcriptional regulator [Prauserella cavernicola]MBK1783747.1 IclR family transcriptional regulator [Prauserella cavernicola]